MTLSPVSAVVSLLSTPCYDLLPPFIKPFFVSHAFIPNPASKSIPLGGALTPPLTYFLALFLLSSPAPSLPTKVLRDVLAFISGVTFFLLPYRYYVPGSAIFTYQLGLIGCFGSARVIDIFFLSRPRVPKRIQIPQKGATSEGTIEGYLRKPELGHEEASLNETERDGRVYPHTDNLAWKTSPVPTSFFGRIWWSVDLMISMRGIGWDFASADVRHDISPWQPPSRRQLKRAASMIFPAFAVSVIMHESQADLQTRPSIIDIPMALRPVMVLATGIALYTLFDCGYTVASAVLLPLLRTSANLTDVSLHNVDFFPLLNPLKLTEICSVRSFWSKAWHRLFHRAWLVFGILPVQNLALYFFPKDNAKILSPASHPDPGRLLPKGTHDWAKVLGAFAASGLVHGISERAALGGRIALPANNLWLKAGWGTTHRGAPDLASTAGLAGREELGGKLSVTRLVPPFSGGGEATFFVLNGVAVLVEGAFNLWIRKQRKRKAEAKRQNDEELERPYDRYVGLAWAVVVLLWSGEAFVEGWIKSGIMAELTFAPH
ncbi:hypothetical protein BCV69DRAFT_244645 [Microstroma glucosiphilum]|uniref:Wax synthase domain-containing protein n=1 Tax=Pseudomicrostroma glucosiphilum TaxID=1684307 RepID=A0A316UBZ9_9BASI|nr:hypothetical protein BCV69DRAFT_244645 [Pseudomicrostroma glucosiphilum]PWN22716.1 hypothetical protein BCV69DRAFT_244645 [Pseudomicrostroma glucosiphilum]